ncbi:SMI1/KNR4 family protein [Streptomyces sp. NPDC056738]|uniref:SMI1/KNR4 family protein n=1 Tax=Streptomyces sp. NPDC056738 TaxID=3345933 RepID=UPI0036C932B9
MTSAGRTGSSLQTATDHAVPDEHHGPDDALIEKLRVRAWDPGLRFDTAEVPLAWIRKHFGGEEFEHLRGPRSPRTVTLDAQAPEVAGYFADAPRGPLFPPITQQEIEAAESAIGYPLPELLRRIYTEVGNGGFGPEAGIASLTPGQRAPGHMTDWPSSVREHERSRTFGMPTSWLFLAPGGCSMEWYVSLLAADNPVLFFDADEWDPDEGQNPHDGLCHTTASLRQWLRTWADGGGVQAEVLRRP